VILEVIETRCSIYTESVHCGVWLLEKQRERRDGEEEQRPHETEPKTKTRKSNPSLPKLDCPPEHQKQSPSAPTLGSHHLTHPLHLNPDASTGSPNLPFDDATSPFLATSETSDPDRGESVPMEDDEEEAVLRTLTRERGGVEGGVLTSEDVLVLFDEEDEELEMTDAMEGDREIDPEVVEDD